MTFAFEAKRGEQIARALGHLARALAPGGLLSLADRFRDDRRRDAAAAIRVADPAGLGLTPLGPGLFRRG